MAEPAPGVRIRTAEHDDADAVAAIAERSWPDREGVEYLPDVFEDWIERDGARTVVAEATDADDVPGDAPAVAAIAQCVLLSDDEAWAQGMRVHPAYRGRGIGSAIVADLFEWARERGATVARNMVYSWNGAGLGQSRANGFAPATELRFVHPEPDASAESPGDASAGSSAGPATGSAPAVVHGPDAAWRYWTHSDAREHLRGLAAADEERWAVRELTRADLDRRAGDGDSAGDGGVLAIQTGEGTRAMAVRTRIDERAAAEEKEASDEDGAHAANQTVAVYGATAWADRSAAVALFDAIAADAAAVDADETKVLVPETARHVSDAAACRVPIADHPDFVLAADLAGER